MQNNALSRAELSSADGKVMNVHYGDILIKYGEVIDVKKDELTYLLDESLVKKYQTSLLQNGDIIIADAAEDETVGKCSEMAGLTDEIVLSGLHTIPCRPKENFAEGYLGYYMNSGSYHDQLLPLIQGTKISSISKSAIQNTYIMYPKAESEQEQIGAYFKQLDRLITLHQRQPFSHSTPDISLSVQLIHPFYTSSWEQRKLGDMGTTFTGLSGKTKEDFGHGDAKFITYMNVFSNPVADLKMTESVEIDTKQNCVKAGDVFFTTSSETPEEVGMSCVMPENADNVYLNSFCFGYRPVEKFDLNYLAYVLRADSFRKEMAFLAQGISRYNISKNKVMDVEIPVPILAEQSKVGQYFRNLDHLITLHQRKGKAAVSGCSNDTNNAKGVCCNAGDFGYKCHKKVESQ